MLWWVYSSLMPLPLPVLVLTGDDRRVGYIGAKRIAEDKGLLLLNVKGWKFHTRGCPGPVLIVGLEPQAVVSGYVFQVRSAEVLRPGNDSQVTGEHILECSPLYERCFRQGGRVSILT
jgi:hypothetical protein